MIYEKAPSGNCCAVFCRVSGGTVQEIMCVYERQVLSKLTTAPVRCKNCLQLIILLFVILILSELALYFALLLVHSVFNIPFN